MKTKYDSGVTLETALVYIKYLQVGMKIDFRELFHIITMLIEDNLRLQAEIDVLKEIEDGE